MYLLIIVIPWKNNLYIYNKTIKHILKMQILILFLYKVYLIFLYNI